MNTTTKVILGVVAVVVFGLASGYAGGLAAKPDPFVSGTNENRRISFDEGIAVDNLTVIDGSGNIVGSSTISLDGSARFGATVLGSATGTVPSLLNSTSTSSSTVLTASDICDNTIFDVNSGTSTFNIVFPQPTSTTALCLAENGDTRSLFFWNATSGANTARIVTSTPGVTGWITVLNNPVTSTAAYSFSVKEGMRVDLFRRTSSSIILEATRVTQQ